IHKQDVYKKCAYSADGIANVTFLQKATHRYFKNRKFIAHKSYLFFVLPLDKTLKSGRYVNPFRKVEHGIQKKIDRKIHEFIQVIHDTVSLINNNSKTAITPMHGDAVLKLRHFYFNGFNEGLDTDISLDKKGITITDAHFDILAVNSELWFREGVHTSKINDKFTSDEFSFHQGFIDGLGLALNENHVVNHVLYLDDKHSWRKSLAKKIEELPKSSNFGTQNKVVLKKIR